MTKKALITGSSSGIGAEIASVLCNAGFDVFITGRNKEKLDKVFEKINPKGMDICDLREKESYKNLFNKALEVLGDIDVLVNNAGEYLWSPIEKIPEDKISEIIKLNLEIPCKLIKEAVPSMKNNKWGRIINIGSISGAVGEANAAIYSASKAGLSGLTKALALELAEYNITANIINPGWVKTPMSEGFEEEIECIPQKRFIHPNEVANLVKYLCSEEARGITGQNLNICAGLSLG